VLEKDYECRVYGLRVTKFSPLPASETRECAPEMYYWLPWHELLTVGLQWAHQKVWRS